MTPRIPRPGYRQHDHATDWQECDTCGLRIGDGLTTQYDAAYHAKADPGACPRPGCDGRMCLPDAPHEIVRYEHTLDTRAPLSPQIRAIRERGQYALVRSRFHGGGLISRHTSLRAALEAWYRMRSTQCCCGCAGVIDEADLLRLPAMGESMYPATAQASDLCV